MKHLRSLNLHQLAQRIFSVCMSVVLAIGFAVSYGCAALAATDTTSPATQTDRSYNVIGQDNNEENGNLIEQSRDLLKTATENIRETLTSGSSSNSADDDFNTSGNDIGDRAGNRLERAKGVFQGATERTAEGSNSTATGQSNR